MYFRLEENGVLTDCSLKTQDPEETLDFNFCSTNVINKIIMKVLPIQAIVLKSDMAFYKSR